MPSGRHPELPMPETPRDPVFIVGCGRSGTTMLAYVLNRHPRVKVTPETHYLLSVAPRGSRSRRAWSHEEMLDRVQRGPLLGMLGVSRVELSEQFRRGPPTWRDLLDVLLHSYRRRHRADLVCEKSPDHYRFVDRIVSWFPDSRILWLVRDGRDVALSFERAEFTHDWTWVHCQRWMHAARALRKARRRHRERLHVVRFEDFVRRPEEETRRLCGFLGIDFHPGQLEGGPLDDLVTPAERRHKAGANERPDPAQADKWRRIPARDAAVLTWVMQEELARLGYDTAIASRPNLHRTTYLKLKKAVSRVGFVAYYDLLRSDIVRPVRQALGLCARSARTAADPPARTSIWEPD
jgi:hypothetical protein